MKEGLNLLPSMAKFQAAKIKLKKKINLGMIVFGSVWLIFVVVVFGWLAITNMSLNKADKANKNANNLYKSLVTNVVMSLKNKYQAKIVGKVLKERFEYGSSIQKVSTIFSSNIVLDDFEINNKKRFVLKGSLIDGSNLIEVEEKIRDINNGFFSDFKSAKLNSVSINGGVWKFEMEVDLT